MIDLDEFGKLVRPLGSRELLRVRMKRASAMLLLTGWLGAARAPDSVPVAPLKPVTKWTVDYGLTQCAAAREFGVGSDRTVLIIRPVPTGSIVDLFVLQKGSAPQFAEQVRGEADFGNGPIKSWALRYRAADKRALYSFRVSGDDVDNARNAKLLRVVANGKLLAAFELSSMAAMVDGLEKCVVDLARYWNYEGDKDGRIAEQPFGDMRNIFTSKDFPAEALWRGQEGTSEFLLMIDERGKVAGCDVVKTSGIPVFDVNSCNVIRERFRMKPAKDRNGKPVRSMVVTPPITYRIG